MSDSGELLFEQPSKDTLQVILSGSWKLGQPLPSTDDVRQILELAAAVPETKDARKSEGRITFLNHLGNQAVAFFGSASDFLEFGIYL